MSFLEVGMALLTLIPPARARVRRATTIRLRATAYAATLTPGSTDLLQRRSATDQQVAHQGFGSRGPGGPHGARRAAPTQTSRRGASSPCSATARGRGTGRSWCAGRRADGGSRPGTGRAARPGRGPTAARPPQTRPAPRAAYDTTGSCSRMSTEIQGQRNTDGTNHTPRPDACTTASVFIATRTEAAAAENESSSCTGGQRGSGAHAEASAAR